MRLASFSPFAVLAFAVPIMLAAYYLGVRRSTASNPQSNGRVGVFMKVLLMVCLVCVAMVALFVTAGRSANHGGPPVTFAYARSSELSFDNPETLKQMEAEFMKAAADRGSAGYMSYYSDDAVEVLNGAPIIQGKVNIAKNMGFLDDKNNHLTWKPVGADISSSGDLGYTYGTFEFRSLGKDGKPSVERGKYTSIWKKQKDGSWKVVLDMGNASAEAK